MVTDHLGTPRLILDQTGSLATVSRHDYLPFGEELFATVAAYPRSATPAVTACASSSPQKNGTTRQDSITF